eukprot:2789204-Pleurochrysis_carterae.AAC.1
MGGAMVTEAPTGRKQVTDGEAWRRKVKLEKKRNVTRWRRNEDCSLKAGQTIPLLSSLYDLSRHLKPANVRASARASARAQPPIDGGARGHTRFGGGVHECEFLFERAI